MQLTMTDEPIGAAVAPGEADDGAKVLASPPAALRGVEREAAALATELGEDPARVRIRAID